jgi:SCP-2 sterol transfer family
VSRGGARVARLDRRPLPHKVILLALPLAIAKRFDAASARDLEAVFELRVRDPGGDQPARFELAIGGGACEVRARAARDPGAGIELGADDMIRLVSGASGWPELLSGGRLALTGDPFLALRFPGLFRLAASAAE